MCCAQWLAQEEGSSWLKYLFLLRWINVVTRHIRRQTEEVCHQRNAPLGFTLAVRPFGDTFNRILSITFLILLLSYSHPVFTHPKNKSVDLKRFRPRVLKSGVPSAEGGGRFPLFPTSSSVCRSKALPLTTDPREWGINGRAHCVLGVGGSVSQHTLAHCIFSQVHKKAIRCMSAQTEEDLQMPRDTPSIFLRFLIFAASDSFFFSAARPFTRTKKSHRRIRKHTVAIFSRAFTPAPFLLWRQDECQRCLGCTTVLEDKDGGR